MSNRGGVMAEGSAGDPAHAIQRAKERFGLKFTVEDLKALAKRCLAGEGRVETKADGSSVHALVHGSKVLWIVYSAATRQSRPFGTIITVLPPEEGRRRTARDARQRQRRIGDFKPWRKSWN